MSSPVPSLPLSRLIAHTADAVQAVREGRSLTDVLARTPEPARAGTQALSFHVLRRLGAATAARAALAEKTPPAAIDALLVSAIALVWPDGAAPYAEHTLVDQAVTAARARAPASAAFVNAVLRRFLRERDALNTSLQRDPVAAWNHPGWWIEHVRRDWPQQWQALLRAANTHPPMTLRVNARRGAAQRYVERLAAQGVSAIALDAQAVMLGAPRPVHQLPGFAEGEVSVQDAAAQLAAPLLLHPWLSMPMSTPLRVLDACAAPGGKTAHLLELADIDLLALDSDAQRLVKVQDSLKRLGLHAHLMGADARQPATWWDGQPFDAILLDAPCSASGIVRRHPDVRWLRRASDIPAMVQTQAELLEAVWPTLARGGRLLYCTCSLFKPEGQTQIDAFLQRHSDASLARDPPSPGHLLPLADNPGSGSAGSASGPEPAPMDGFYYALLEKT